MSIVQFDYAKADALLYMKNAIRGMSVAYNLKRELQILLEENGVIEKEKPFDYSQVYTSKEALEMIRNW